MMQHSLVHIGYHKTATTWFQKQYYPMVENATYVDRRKVKEAFLNTSAFYFDSGRAHKVLDADEPFIICEEGLCGHYENAGLHGCLSKDVAYRIRDTLPDAQIVIFIRNQPDMIAAIYLQYVRRGGTASVNHFLYPYQRYRRFNDRRFKKPMFLFDHFDYLHLIRHYRDLFGASRVHVFPYEAFLRDSKAFIADYGRRFGLEIDFNRINFRPKKRSYRGGTLRAARLLNHVAGGDAVYQNGWVNIMPKKIRLMLMEGWNRLPVKGEKLTPEKLLGPRVIDHIHKQFAKSNKTLAAELELPLAEYGYPMA